MTEFVANTNEYAVENSSFEKKPAGFWIRFFAYLVDLIVIQAVLVGLVVYNIFKIAGIEDFTVLYISLMGIANGIVFYLYFTILTKYFSQTLGKMIFGIKVVNDSGEPLNWATVLFRETIGRFISATILVLYVITAFTKKNKAVHDFIADTHVVYERAYSKKSDNQEITQSKSLKEVYNEKEMHESES